MYCTLISFTDSCSSDWARVLISSSFNRLEKSSHMMEQGGGVGGG